MTSQGIQAPYKYSSSYAEVRYTTIWFSIFVSFGLGHDEVLDLFATSRGLFGGHRLTFDSVVPPLVGVVFFPSPSHCGSCVIP